MGVVDCECVLRCVCFGDGVMAAVAGEGGASLPVRFEPRGVDGEDEVDEETRLPEGTTSAAAKRSTSVTLTTPIGRPLLSTMNT